jgi:hypothetical protein
MDATNLILEQLRGIKTDLADIRRDGSERGRDIWKKLNDQDRELALLGHRFGKLEESVTGQASTLQKYQDLHKQAQGAGWLGQRLLRFGIVILGFAGWIYASWATIVGALKWIIGR